MGKFLLILNHLKEIGRVLKKQREKAESCDGGFVKKDTERHGEHRQIYVD